MTWRDKLTGFYSILDRDDEHLARLLAKSTDQGGAGSTVMQVRIKPRSPIAKANVLAIARMARTVTAQAGTLLIINDDIDIALAVDADGVHLGQNDLPLAEAKRLVARFQPKQPFLIGISTNTNEQIRTAVDGGADYLGFGPVFTTTTKENPDPVRGLDGLAEAVRAAGDTPVVAIGGIKPTHAQSIANAGAIAACCISAVNNSENPAAVGVTVGQPWRS